MGSVSARHDEALALERAAREDAEKALKRAELFIAMLGHELRTPLTAIIAAAQLLDETVEAEPDHQLVHRVESNARRIERMAAQLLDLGRIRSGNGIELDPVPCDLRAIIQGCRGEILAFRSADVRLELHGRFEGVWDQDRLAQIFSNLMRNAVEHSNCAFPPCVTVDGQHDGVVRVSIHNTTAIPADLLPTIFDPFQHGRAKARRNGLGLGLYITRELVVAHGGTISVRSTPSAGTTVLVTLPREPKKR